jgi:hypothetical protein
MGHVEALAERILFLKGDAEIGAAGNVAKITLGMERMRETAPK